MAFSCAVSCFADVFPVSAIASCSTRAALMVGTNFWSESYSPRNAEPIDSRTSVGSALLNDPRSAANVIMDLDMSAAGLAPTPSWSNMFPKLPAASRVDLREMPSDLDVVLANLSIPVPASPNTDCTLDSDSAVSAASFMPSPAHFRANPAMAAPATAAYFFALSANPDILPPVLSMAPPARVAPRSRFVVSAVKLTFRSRSATGPPPRGDLEGVVVAAFPFGLQAPDRRVQPVAALTGERPELAGRAAATATELRTERHPPRRPGAADVHPRLGAT